MKRIEDGIGEDEEMEDWQRLSLYKKRKALEAESGQKKNLKMADLEDFTAQEIETDIDLQILRHKKLKQNELD